jgi:multidrug efflux pump subunit AcrA (membrane-fusion protein)
MVTGDQTHAEPSLNERTRRPWEVLEFINSPSPWALRIAVGTVAVSVFIAVVASPLIPVRRKVSANGIVISELGVRQIAASRSGTFRRSVPENSAVLEGDTIGFFEIRGLDEMSMGELVELVSALESDDFVTDTTKIGAQARKISRMVEDSKGQFADAEINYPLVEMVNQYESMVTQVAGLRKASKLELSPLRLSLSRIDEKIRRLTKGRKNKDMRYFVESLEDERRKLSSSVAQIENSYKLRETDAIANFGNVVKRSRVQLNLFLNSSRVKSPISGRLFSWRVPDKAQVQKETTLAEILPASSRVLAKLAVKANDQPKVKIGQLVYMKLESFPYQKFGIFEGTVTDVKQVSQDGNFAATVEIAFKPDVTGDRLPIGSAMTSEIVTGESSLARAAFEKITGEFR